MSAAGTAGSPLSVPEKLLRGHVRVLDDLAEQEGGDVAAAMHRNGCSPTVWVAKLFVRTPLPYFFESHPLEYRDHISRRQHR